MTDIKVNSEIAQASQGATTMNFLQAEEHAMNMLKLARKVWDNKINQEYMTYTIGIDHNQQDRIGGFVKFYISRSFDYYKKVEHTYKPTQEDTEATDWYII